MVKKIAVAIFGILFFQSGFGQRIINNSILFDIDEDYDTIDTIISNNKILNVNCYRCNTQLVNKDSCILYYQKQYDKSGRLVELIKVDNINRNRVAYTISYRKLSDLSFESIAKFSTLPRIIPDNFYIDTIVQGKSERIYLYKKDETNKLFVRSLYTRDSSGNLADIKRYDIDNKLVHIYYPFGSRKPKQQWSETVVNGYDSTISSKTTYTENELLLKHVYNKKGNICEITEVNNTFGNGDKLVTKKYIIYNSAYQPIIRITLDQNNQLISEERYYYNKRSLIKYTEDDDIEDSVLREERLFNEMGEVILTKSYNKYTGSIMTWKYFYSKNGLLEKEVYYLDGKYEFSKIYTYK